MLDLTIRAVTPAERLYVCDQNKHIADQSGNTGRLWGKLDDTGIVYLKSWEIRRSMDNTPGFRAEFDTVLNMLRFDERYGYVLKDLTTMISFCSDHPQGQLANCAEYAFRADTQDYSYLIRCIPQSDNDHVFIYHYHRDRLDRHMKQAEKSIRFVTPDNREKFKIPDGERFRITTSGAGTRVKCGGCPICSDETGYFYAARQSEIRATVAQLSGHISKIAAAKNGLLKSQ